MIKLKDIIIEIHAEHVASTFPSGPQLIAIKKFLDSETEGYNKVDVAKGMKIIGLKTIYDLVLWGLKTGIIRDEPITNLEDKVSIPGTGGGYSDWLRLLNYIVAGYSDQNIEKEGGFNKTSIDFFKKKIASAYGLGPSPAKLIRFAFQVLNPISPPKIFYGWKAEGITTEQARILRFVAQGYNTKEIADILNININTVSYHIDKLKKYFGIKTKSGPAYAELTRIALAHMPDVLSDRPTKINKRPVELYQELTPREKAIFQLIAKGVSPIQAAKGLGLSIKTIEHFKANIMNKLGLYNPSDLTAYGVKHNLLIPDNQISKS